MTTTQGSTSRARKTTADKARVAAAVAIGQTDAEAVKAGDIDRSTLYRWRLEDAEYQHLEREAIEKAAKAAMDGISRALHTMRLGAPQAVEALIRGIEADRKYRHVKLGNAAEGTERVEVVAVPDLGLSVKSAVQLLERLEEFAKRTKVDHEVSGSIVTILQQLDAEADAGPGD